jgi:hypothetical protein
MGPRLYFLSAGAKPRFEIRWTALKRRSSRAEGRSSTKSLKIRAALSPFFHSKVRQAADSAALFDKMALVVTFD